MDKEEKQETQSNRDAKEIKQEGGGETYRQEATLISRFGALEIVVYKEISKPMRENGKVEGR
jgi:hypothetical protein